MKTMSNFYPRPVALYLIWLIWLCSVLPGLAQNPPTTNTKVHWLTQSPVPPAAGAASATFRLDNATVATVSRADVVTTFFSQSPTWQSGPYSGDQYQGLQINGTTAANSSPDFDITFPAGFNSDGVVLAIADMDPNVIPNSGGNVGPGYTLQALDASGNIILSTTWAPSGGWSQGNSTNTNGCTQAINITNMAGNAGIDLRPTNAGEGTCAASSRGVAIVVASPDVRTIQVRKAAYGAGDAIVFGMGIFSDASDAPTSYTTLWNNISTAGGPWHRLLANASGAPESLLKMGATEVVNGNGLPGADANLDTDEDGIASFPAVSTTSITVTDYDVTVAVTNTTGSTANLYGWVDWNNNGVFDAAERVSTTVADGATSAELTWPSATVVNVGNRLYSRFRLTTATLTAPTGGAPDGEVEDYRIAMTPPQPISGRVLNDNDGQNGGVNGNPVAGATVTLFGPDGTTVVATTTTDANGNYTFANVPAGDYTVGVTPPGGFDNVSSSDGITPTDGRTAVTVGAAPVTGVNFGVNQPPAAVGSTLPAQQNPGGTTNVTIPPTAFSGTDPNSGTIASLTITEFPTNATSITVNGATYTAATFPAGGINVPTDAAGNPQQTIAIDPVDGAVSPVITFTVTDNAGLTSAAATVTIPLTVPPAATNDSSTGNQPGTAVTQDILVNDDLADGSQATPTNTTVALNTTGLPTGSTLSADGHTATVPGEGTWVYNPATGNLTFTPLATFTGNPTPVPYTLTETATGLTDPATVSVTYGAPPIATNDSSTGNQPGTAVTQDILANDDLADGSQATPTNTTVALNTTGLPTGSTVSADGHTVTVPGEGTWVYNPATGNLTFTPLATFTGNPTPAPYTLTETATGLTDPATVSVTYGAPPVATNDSSIGNQPGTAVTQDILANDDLADGSQATPANTTVALNTTGLPTGSTVSADGHTVTVPGEGTWVYNPATGALTFTPLATFTGNPTPVPYTLTETATGLTDTATAAVTYDQAIVFDYGDLPYTGAAVNYPKVKAQFRDADNNHVPDDAGAVWLGQIIDAEADGFTNPVAPTDYAKGDDNSGVDDEDGLKFSARMAPGTTVDWTVTANSNGPATVHYGMWIDWGTPTAGPDGTFDNFYSGTITTASPASQTVTVTVPSTFQQGLLVNVRLIASTTPLDQATGFSTNIINGEIEDFQMSFSEALPVRLVSFQASANENNATLTWKAADQVRFDRYEIERSLNGKQFSLVGTELSNNLKAGDYRFTDPGAASVGATLYYRLKMVDTDGSYAYSSIRSITFKDAPILTASAWPTVLAPGETVYVALSGHNGPYQVTMFSTGGREILDRKVDSVKGQIQLPTQGLPFGIYLIKVNTGGWQKTLRIAIVK